MKSFVAAAHTIRSVDLEKALINLARIVDLQHLVDAAAKDIRLLCSPPFNSCHRIALLPVIRVLHYI